MKILSPRQFRSAFSLIEVTMALGIVAFGLIAILGLLPTGLNLARECRDETVAVNILSALASDLQYREESSGKTRLYQVHIEGGRTGRTLFDQNGGWLGAAADSPEAIYAGSWEIRSQSKGMPAHALVRVGWPALSPQATGMVETLVVFPRDSAVPEAED